MTETWLGEGVMAYRIDATLAADGTPRLRVVDVHTGQPRLEWDAAAVEGPALKSLFHELLLLSAADRLRPLES